MQQPASGNAASRPPSEATGRRRRCSSRSERWAHSACCQKVALNATVAGNVALLRRGGNNAADALLCHTGHDNCGDGIRMTVVAVIISNRRDLIVSTPCGGLLPGASAVRVWADWGVHRSYFIDLLCIYHNTWSPKWEKNSRDELMVIKYPWEAIGHKNYAESTGS